VVQVLSFSGGSHDLTFYLGTMLRALGRADLALGLVCIPVCIRVVVSLLIVSYGLVALAISSVVVTALAAPLLFHLVARRIGV